VLQVRAVAPPSASHRAATAIDRIEGVRNVVTSDVTVAGDRVISADVDSDCADQVLDALTDVGLSAEAVTLLRLETVPPAQFKEHPWIGGATDEPTWAEVVGEARSGAQMLARYAVLMAVAGTIASIGVLDGSEILIVGAMAVSPDLLPMSAACVGIVGRRPRLAARAIFSLVAGLVIAGAAAAIFGRLLQALDVFDETGVQTVLGTLTNTDAASVAIALAAGVAGMLTFETRAGNAVGVAISITTIPAAAYFGVQVGEGDGSDALGALGVLGTNITCVLIAGSITLWVQRWWWERFD
jgi:uncharacterized hydrophobic protein (TIGR00271 family)